jgi:flavin reductase (DIM6/NTAB) family NADH-FMN oxidoreductase RutF
MIKTRLGACVTFFPQPTTLISSVDENGSLNIMTASWAGVVSKTPPTMAISLHHKRKSYRNICFNREFVVNMVPAKLAVEADYCGLRSGADVDKLAATGLTTSAADIVSVPVVNEAPLNLECRLTLEVPLGDYRLLIAEILEVHADQTAVLENGRLDATVFDPLVYLGGVREYWSLGEKRANAYSAGLKLDSES